MAVFVTADLHLSLGTDKPMDIFGGWSDYVMRLEQNWSKIVTPNDTVVIVGDISWAMKLEECEKDFGFIHALPGKKIFIKGNHDYWWGTKRKLDEFIEKNKFDTISILFNNSFTADGISISGSRGWFYDIAESGDKKVLNREANRLRMSIEAAQSTPIVFLHYPPVFGDYVCNEIMDVLKEYDIKKCYYGHLHGAVAHKKAFNGVFEGIDFKLISCDSTDFTPVLVRA